MAEEAPYRTTFRKYPYGPLMFALHLFGCIAALLITALMLANVIRDYGLLAGTVLFCVFALLSVAMFFVKRRSFLKAIKIIAAKRKYELGFVSPWKMFPLSFVLLFLPFIAVLVLAQLGYVYTYFGVCSMIAFLAAFEVSEVARYAYVRRWENKKRKVVLYYFVYSGAYLVENGITIK